MRYDLGAKEVFAFERTVGCTFRRTFKVGNISLILISVIHGIIESFSMPRNWTSLTKKSNEDIGMLSLLKVALAALAVSVHSALFEVMGPISNGLDFDEVSQYDILLSMTAYIL